MHMRDIIIAILIVDVLIFAIVHVPSTRVDKLEKRIQQLEQQLEEYQK